MVALVTLASPTGYQLSSLRDAGGERPFFHRAFFVSFVCFVDWPFSFWRLKKSLVELPRQAFRLAGCARLRKLYLCEGNGTPPLPLRIPRAAEIDEPSARFRESISPMISPTFRAWYASLFTMPKPERDRRTR